MKRNIYINNYEKLCYITCIISVIYIINRFYFNNKSPLLFILSYIPMIFMVAYGIFAKKNISSYINIKIRYLMMFWSFLYICMGILGIQHKLYF